MDRRWIGRENARALAAKRFPRGSVRTIGPIRAFRKAARFVADIAINAATAAARLLSRRRPEGYHTKLNREVAIKILPDAFANDSDRLARFQREPQMLASLNHPNIAAIYGVEDRALILELVEGGTLAGPLPLETALNYARQIADALDATHKKGVIHRDLKPTNIKVTPDGRVKIQDFGQAKAADRGVAPIPLRDRHRLVGTLRDQCPTCPRRCPLTESNA